MSSFRERLKKKRQGTSSPPGQEISPAAVDSSPQASNVKLARKRADRGEDVVVAGSGIDGGGVQVLVTGDSLSKADVARRAIDVRERRMPKLVEREEPIESSSLLPDAERAPDGSSVDASAKSADEERSVDSEILPAAALPTIEPTELVGEVVGNEDGLGNGVGSAALEDAQLDAAPDLPGGKHVAYIECGDLHLSHAGAESDGEQDMVPVAADVLAGDTQKPGLLGGSHGGGGASDSIDVAHGLPPVSTFASEPDEVNERYELPDSPRSTVPTTPTSTPLVVVKRDEDDFAEWLATESGFLLGFGRFEDEDIKLEPYQLAFINCDADYRCVEKSRQVGYSWMFACEAIARTHLRETHNSIFVSYNLADSKEKIAYAATLHEELPLEYQKKKVVDSKTELGFRSNSSNKRVSRIISNPSRAPRGKKGDIYLDELAHYANDREVYKGSTALILRAKGQLTVCSSPLGRRGQFWEIARQEVRPYGSYWRQAVPWWLCSFFCEDVARAAVEAPSMPTKERVMRFGTKGIINQFESLPLEDFQQEFEVLYVDESMSFFPYELILSNTNDEHEVVDDFTKVKPSGSNRLIAGYDVGRKNDFSELSLFEEFSDGRLVARMFMRFEKVKFRIQENTLRRMMNLLPIARLSIDQNGIGMQLTENLAEDFPQVEACTLTGTSKEAWLTDFKILLQHQKLVLPRDRQLISQIHSIRKRITPAGRPVYESNDSGDDDGHADRLWSCVLACKKDRTPVAESAEVAVRIIG